MPDPWSNIGADDPMTPEEEAELLEAYEAAIREPGVWLVLDDARDIECLF